MPEACKRSKFFSVECAPNNSLSVETKHRCGGGSRRHNQVASLQCGIVSRAVAEPSSNARKFLIASHRIHLTCRYCNPGVFHAIASGIPGQFYRFRIKSKTKTWSLQHCCFMSFLYFTHLYLKLLFAVYCAEVLGREDCNK